MNESENIVDGAPAGQKETLLCNLDNMQRGGTYRFEPALPLALVQIMNKKQFDIQPRINQIKATLFAKGLEKGTLLTIQPIENGMRLATFNCLTELPGPDPKTTVRYTATCKFSKERAEGTVVDVQEIARD